MRGYEISSKHGTLINVDDVSDATFCLYIVLLKNIDKIKPSLSSSATLRQYVYHKVHYIVHRFGTQSAYKILREVENSSNPDVRALLKAIKSIIEKHKIISPKKNVVENVEIKSPALGIFGIIPLIRDGIPIIEKFEFEAPNTPSFEDKIKATGYVLLLEYQNKSPLEYAEIEYPIAGKTFSVLIDDRLRRIFLNKREEIENIIRAGEIRRRVIIVEDKCKVCPYYRHCKYRMKAKRIIR